MNAFNDDTFNSVPFSGGGEIDLDEMSVEEICLSAEAMWEHPVEGFTSAIWELPLPFFVAAWKLNFEATIEEC